MRWTYTGLAWLIVAVAAAGCGPGGGGGDTDPGADTAGDVEPAPDTGPDTAADTGGDTGDVGGDTAGEPDGAGDTGGDADTGPAIGFRELSDGDAVNGAVTVAAEISGTDAVESVEFLIDAESVETADRAPWEFEWPTNLYDERAHELELIATLEGGSTMSAVAEVWVDRTEPSVEIVEPEQNTMYIDQVPMKATIDDNYEIDRVVFKVDAGTAEETLTSPPWETSVDLSAVEDGLHTVGVTAYDVAGLQTKKNVTFTLGCESDDDCSGEKLCVEDQCQALTPQCSQAGESCNPDSRRPAGPNFACKDTGFGPECRPSCTVTSDPSASSCGGDAICLGADIGNEGYCVESQCTGPTDTSSCDNVQANDLFSDFANGAKCRGVGNGVNLCVPAGSQNVGDTCNAVSPVVGLFCEQGQTCEACGSGLSCVNGTCHTVCQGDAACSSDPEGSTCIGAGTSTILGNGVGFCDEQCEAFSRGQCSGSNEGCVSLNNSVGYCHSAGSKGYMAECTPPDATNPNRRECAPGMQCLVLQSANSTTGQQEVARCVPRCKPSAQGGIGTNANDVTCRGKVYGRFLYLGSSPSAADFYLNGDRKVDDLTSGTVSDADGSTPVADFFELQAASMTVDGVDGSESTNNNPLATATSPVTSGEVVTWALVPTGSGHAVTKIPVPRNQFPPSGKAAVRAVLMVSGKSVDVMLASAGASDLSNATTIASGLSGNADEFVEVDSGTYDVYVFDTNQSNKTIGNELRKFTDVALNSQVAESLYIHRPSSSSSNPYALTTVPYRSAPEAVARTCWAGSDNPAPASGICLQQCQIEDYGTGKCAGDSNGCAPFGQHHFCLPRGDASPGDSCSPKVQSAYSDCEEGAYCEERGDGSGECASYCIGGSSSNATLSCSSNRTCTAASGSVGTCRLSCSPDGDFKNTSTCPSNLQSCLPATESGGSYSGAFCSASGSTTVGNQCGEGRPEGASILQNCEAGKYCAYGDGTEESLLAGMFQQRAGNKPTCRESCEPFGSASCPSGQACGVDLVYGGGTAAGICLDEASSASSSRTGTSCNQSDVGKMCGDHSICIPNRSSYICLEFCRWSDKSGCSTGTSCQRPQNGLIAGVIGFCL